MEGKAIENSLGWPACVKVKQLPTAEPKMVVPLRGWSPLHMGAVGFRCDRGPHLALVLVFSLISFLFFPLRIAGMPVLTLFLPLPFLRE